jgi:DNA-binding NtrC family response regulator
MVIRSESLLRYAVCGNLLLVAVGYGLSGTSERKNAMYSEITILVLSRNTDGSGQLARALADDFRVVEAESAEEANAHIRSGTADLIIAEIADPAFEDFAGSSAGVQSSIPLVVATEEGNVEAAVEAMKKGAADCIEKPINSEKLRSVVSRLLNRSTMQPEGNQQICIPPGTSLGELERVAVEQALGQHQGNRTHAARTLGISVRTLQRKLKAWENPSPPTSNGSQGKISSEERSNGFVLQSPTTPAAYTTTHVH